MTPFVSEAQRSYMFAHHPEMAKEWEAKTPKDAALPQHVKPNLQKVKRRSSR